MQNDESEFSFRSLILPFTTSKAIHYLILIGFIVYANSLFNGFVGDDHGQILTNPLIHSLSNMVQFFRGSTLYIEQVGQSAGLYYRPILSLTFATIYALFGANAFPFHLFQLSLHITNSILIFLLLSRHLKRPTSFVLALIFLLHPINNEAVVYISNLQEQLFAFFGLLSLYLLSIRRRMYAIPVLLFFSLLSKETGIIFLPLTLLYYFLFCERSASRTKWYLFSIVGVIALYVLLRVFIGNIGANTDLLYMSSHASFIERLYTLPSIIVYYLRGVFYPISLAFGWYWVIKQPTLQNFGVPLLISLMFIGAVFFSYFLVRKKKDLHEVFIFFFVLFLLSSGIIIQLFPLDLTVADRWFYMPLLGILVMVGVLSMNYEKKLAKYKRVGLLLLTVMFLFFGARDIIRNTNWADNYTLCKHDVTVNTQSYILEYCLSNELYGRKDYQNAEIHAVRAIQLYPEYFLSWYTLGKIYYANGEPIKAQHAFTKTLRYNDFALGSEELALIAVYAKNTSESRKITDTYLEVLPNSAQLWYARALTEYLDGNSEAATVSAKRAYELNPAPLTEKVYMRLENNLPITF